MNYLQSLRQTHVFLSRVMHGFQIWHFAEDRMSSVNIYTENKFKYNSLMNTCRFYAIKWPS